MMPSGDPPATTEIPEWEGLFPWLRAGTTRRVLGACANADEETRGAAESVASASAGLLGAGWRSVVRSRQVHGTVTRVHSDLPPGEAVAGDGDGHVTCTAGLLLTVTLADCVPVFVVDPARTAVALLHAGWRGTAAGVLETGLATMSRTFGSVPSELCVHLGPAICGRCYEVGPEVFEALGETAPTRPTPLDLRGVIGRRALAAGVSGERLSVSGECTLCSDARYFSHRGGDAGRHLGFIGILPKSGVGGRVRPA